MPITLNKPSPDSRKDFILAVDPSINKLGYAIFEIVPENNIIGYDAMLRDFGLIESTEEKTTSRVCQMVTACERIAHHYHCTGVIVEMPPSTMYVAPGDTPNKIIARATSVFKTVAVARCVLHHFLSRGKQAMPILPVQWEEHHSRRGGVDVKEWTLREANRLIGKAGIARTLRPKTKDTNIGDAILLGYRMIFNVMQHKEMAED